MPDERTLSELGYTSLLDFDSRFVTTRSNNAKAWRLNDVIPGRYNRMVVFEGCKVFHGVSELYGDSAEHGRLTQNFFFNLKPAGSGHDQGPDRLPSGHPCSVRGAGADG